MISRLVVIASTPLHFTLGDLGTDLQRNAHAQIRITLGHGGDEVRAVAYVAKFFFKSSQIVTGKDDRRDVRGRTRRQMAWDDDGRLARYHSVEILHPYATGFGGCCIGGPHMRAGKNQNTAEDGAERRYPEIATIRESIGVNDLNVMALQMQLMAIKDFRHDNVRQGLRAVFL